MQQVLKAVLPVVVVVGLIIGVRAFLKTQSEKAATAQTAQKAATNQAALKVAQDAERSASNALTGFVVRPGLRVTKTNVDEVGMYMDGIAGAVVQAERMKSNRALSPELQAKAGERTLKEFVPEAVRVLKEAGETLPLARVEQLNQIIVPRVPYNIARLITNAAPAPALREAAGSAAGMSAMTHTPEQLASFLIKLHDGVTNANSELGKGGLSQTAAGTMAGIRDRNMASIDAKVREIRQSPWTPKQFLAFRALVSDASGALKPVRLTDSLTPEQVDKVEAAFRSLFISGEMTKSPPLASVEKNSPDEVAKKLFEILAEMKTKRESLAAIKASGKEQTPEWWTVGFSISADSQEELSKIVRNVVEHGKDHWTAGELTAFLGQMKGTNGAAFGALFDATYGKGEPIIAPLSRQAMEAYLGPLIRR